ncbi:alpha/beta hydrolase [Lignipirellula cremea]|uniref:Lipase 2 n=1 Tax=Lignipirellula cremea TaxID=2528010 RepID=A0A518DTN6_9BACT|nr:alpha/beta hydrolase [Lignipirellula cremea]QDU95199.1 Lipase 2 [Lignipirellula cremea]
MSRKAARTIPRRTFLAAGAGLALAGPLASLSRAAAPPIVMKTHTYKKVGDLEIQADVYRPDDDRLRPVVVWIHGGALIVGFRESVSQRVKDWAAEAGYVLVSIDYRLAPETQLPGIIEDLEDAFAWIRREGPGLFSADPSRIAVAGGSAGGYLTLASGYRVTPAPTVLLSFWGYGDLIGPWFSQPSPHARHRTQEVTREEALKQVAGPPISDSRQRAGNGGAFYQYCRQQGVWPQLVSGWDPKKEAAKFYPYMPLKNVTKDYPPTMLMHGTADTDVPFEQSQLMAAAMKRHGAPHELLPIDRGEHGLKGGDPAAINAAYAQAFAFADRYMNAD